MKKTEARLQALDLLVNLWLHNAREHKSLHVMMLDQCVTQQI